MKADDHDDVYLILGCTSKLISCTTVILLLEVVISCLQTCI